MRILVVDDEKVLVKGIKFNLEAEGYEVDACYDGETAVEMAKSGDYDLILLDLMMPKLDGLEACAKIRESSTVPIIMLTARSEDTDKLLGFEYGADDYITKPFNVLELKARVRALLRRSAIQSSAQNQSELLTRQSATAGSVLSITPKVSRGRRRRATISSEMGIALDTAATPTAISSTVGLSRAAPACATPTGSTTRAATASPSDTDTPECRCEVRLPNTMYSPQATAAARA